MKPSTNFYLGIDVSKPYFDVALLRVEDGQKQPLQTGHFDNSAAGLKAFDKWLRLWKVAFGGSTLTVIENTGIYHRLIWKYFSDQALPLYIGNAAHIKWSFGIARGKSDVIDSQRLCSYAFKHADELKATPALNPVLMKLKDLLTARTKLLSQLRGIEVYIKELALSNPPEVQRLMIKAHKAALKGLRQSVVLIETEVKKMVAKNEAIKKNYDLLITVPGVGHLTALYVICCTNNFAGRVSGKQLASFAGVVPFEHTSGVSIKGRNRVHNMANKELKKMLHLCALTAIKNYEEFKEYYRRKKAQGKHSMSVLNAIRNKITLRMAAVVDKQRPYVENLERAA